MKKKYRFYYHWVRSTNKWSVHFKNKCIHTDNVICKAPCQSKINKTQPFRVMQGFSNEIEILDNEVIIY